jgi:thermitase
MRCLCLVAVLILAACSTSWRTATTPQAPVNAELVVALRDPQAVTLLSRFGKVIESMPEDRLYLVRLHDHVKPVDVAVELSQSPHVLFASPNCPTESSATPIDPNYGNQRGLKLAAVDTAWEIWRPVATTAVAIIDTGVDTTHPDLTAKILRNGNQVVGYNASSGNGGFTSDGGTHGTKCASVAAAETNNSHRIAGVAGWDGTPGSSDTTFTKIMPVRAKGDASHDAKGVRWAARNGAHVMSMSWNITYSNALGIPRCLDPRWWDDAAEIEAAIYEGWIRDVIMVAAAGNYGNDSPQLPAKLRGVLSVGAVDLEDKLLGNSSYGSWVDVVAPGISPALTPNNGYVDEFRGTSPAAAIVAGAAALIRSHNPNLNDVYIRHLLRTNVDPYQGSRIREGGGRLNVRRALEAAGSPRIRLTLDPNTTEGGYPKPIAKVTMDPPPSNPLGQIVVLESFEPSHIHLPPIITVPPGGTQTFEIDIVSIPDNPKATIIARGGGGLAATTLWVYPILHGVKDVLTDQQTIRYGEEMARYIIALDSIPKTDIAVTLTSTHPEILRVPSEIYIARGLTQRRLVLRPARVDRPVDVRLTASVRGGIPKSTTVTVTP